MISKNFANIGEISPLQSARGIPIRSWKERRKSLSSSLPTWFPIGKLSKNNANRKKGESKNQNPSLHINLIKDTIIVRILASCTLI